MATVGPSAVVGPSLVVGAGGSSLIWKADLNQADCVAAGFVDDSFQRQNGAGTFNDNTVPWPMVPVTSPGGRAGKSLQHSIPTNYRRYEVVANTADFVAGNNLYFGQAFYLPAGFPTTATNYQVIEQIRQTSAQGSPPVAIEVLDGALKLTGGWGIDAANPTRLAYSQTLLATVSTGVWYNLVYRLGAFSTAENTSTIDVWVNGTQVLTGYVIKPPTLVGGGSYRKTGIYHDPANPAATVYQTGHAIATTYAEADPTPAAVSTPLATLVDRFTAADSASRWTFNGAAVLTTSGGHLAVNASQNAGAPVYSSAKSTAGYTWSGSSLTLELKAVPGMAGDNVNAQAWVMDPAAAAGTAERLGFEYVGSANRLDFLGQTGAFAPIGTTTSLTYDPVAHRWLRIAHSGTAITWSTSPDGLTWTVRRTLTGTLPAWTAKTTLVASFEAFRTTGTNDTLRIARVNTLPAALSGVQPVGEDALQRRTLTELRTWKAWLAANGAAGMVGEFNGVTLFRKYNDVPQGIQWDTLLDVYLKELDYQGIHSAAWASGRNWGQGYPLGIHVGVNKGDPLTIENANAGAVLGGYPTRAGRWRSINLSGHEEGITINGGGTVRTGAPFVHTAADFGFLARNRVDTIRLPVAWERLQPTLGAALDTAALAVLDGMLMAARQVGIRVILDLHNYGRYTQASGTVVALGGALTNAQFSDVWTRLSTWVRANASRSGTVVAYDLMNEPHSLTGGAVAWENASQAALTAIRGGGDNRLILVGGYTFSSLTEWATWHPDGWITDPANNFVYEAHHYWDTQSALGSRSGTYQQSPTGPIETYAIELAAAQNAEGSGSTTPPAVSAGADATVGFGSTFARTATETGTSITARSWKVVSGPLGAGTSIGTAAALSWAPGSSPAGATDIRYPTFAEMAFEMCSTAENSTLNWPSKYGYIEDIGDNRGYTAGIVGFCSGTGDMLDLVQYYSTLEPGNPLEAYIPGLQQTTAVGFGTGASAAAATYLGQAFKDAWVGCANNRPQFRRAQRDKRGEHYWDPALAQALADGVGPLGLAILFDISVNHGPGSDAESFGGIVAAAHADTPPPSSGGDETAYLQALINERVAILSGWGDLQADGRQTIHQTILDSGNLLLEGPVTWSVYGDTYTMPARPAPPQDAVRGTYVLRYSATNPYGTGSDDVTVAVTDPLPETGGDNGVDPILVQTLTVYGNAVGALTTPTFTPAANEVLVVKAVTGHSLNLIGAGAAAGGGLTYAPRGAVTASSYCQARLWTTSVGGAPAEMAVSVTTTGTAYSPTLIVERWHNVTVPLGAGQNSIATGTTADPFTATVTTTSAGAVTWIGADWVPVTGGTPTYRSGAIPNVERRSTAINYWSARQPVTTAGTQTIGMTAPTGQKWSLLAVELAPVATSGGAASVVPAKFVGGYLENWTSILPRNLPAAYGLLFLAFATINADGSVTFTPEQSPSALAADIATRKAQGKPTILSIGGGGGAQTGLGTSAQQTAFFNSVTAVIDQYGFSGIDWDIESGVPGGISVAGLEAVSRQLVARYGSSFAITMAPYGTTAATYKTLATNIKDILTCVNYQFYNGSTVPTASSVLATMNDWMSTCGLREDQFSLGFMHVDDYLGLTTPYSTMVEIYQAVNAAHPGVRGVWDWSVGLDQPSNYTFATTMDPVVFPPEQGETGAPLAEDISTPPTARKTYDTGTAVSSASFNPPVGSTVVVLVSVGWGTVPTTTPTLTVTDSLGGTWTPGPAVFGNATQSAIFYRRITALGGMTVTATSSSAAGKSMLLAARVVTNAAVSQAGAGTATSTTSMTVAGATTTPQSWVYVVGSSGTNNALTPTAATTNIDAWVDTGSGDDLAAGRATAATTTPGTVSLGWAPAGRSVALEVLPGTVVPARSYTLGSPTTEVDSVSRLYRGYIGPAGETNTVSPITRGRARELAGAAEYDSVSPVFDKQYVTDEQWAAAIEADDRQPVIGLFADWDADGQYAHPLSDLTALVESVTVERTISGELPTEVGIVEGSASASLRAELSGRWTEEQVATARASLATSPLGVGMLGVTPLGGQSSEVVVDTSAERAMSPVEAFAPYRTDAPFYRHPMIGTPLKLETGFVTDNGPRTDRRFTGSLRRVNPSSRKRTVTIDALDPANMLRAPITQPSVGIDGELLEDYGDKYLHRYNSQWVIDRVLRANGIYASPPPHPNAVISCTGHGAWIPEIGWCDSPRETWAGSPTVDSTWTNEGHPWDMLYNHPDAPGVSGVWRAYGQSPVNMNPGTALGMSAWVRVPAYAQFGNILQLNHSHVVPYVTQLAVRDGAPGCSINLNNNIFRLYPNDWVVPAQPRWVFVGFEAHFSDTQVGIVLRVDGKTYQATYTIPQRPPARGETRVLHFGQVPATNINVWKPPVWNQLTPWHGERWTSQADIDPGLNELTYIPDLKGEDSWKLIQEVVAAEFGACGFNEHGRFFFRSRSEEYDPGEVEHITADRNLSDLVTTLDESVVRNSIAAEAKPRYVSEEWEWVFELKDSTTMECSPGWSVYDVPLKADTVDMAGRFSGGAGAPWAYFDPAIWERHEEKRYEAFVVLCPVYGADTFVDMNYWGQFIFYVDLIGPRLARLTIFNPSPATIRFEKPTTTAGGTVSETARAEGAFKIGGRVLKDGDSEVQLVEDAGSVLDFGKRTYDLGGANRWRQDLSAVEGIAESVLGSTGRPVPVLERVQVPHDPRRRLYGVVEVADPDGLGSVVGVIAGITTSYSASGAVDELTVRPIGPPGLGVLDDPLLGKLDDTLILGT